ncbi:hypothetical protein APICC_05849 [Apis cerana cerana]|uniref:Uncharacterized protein n=1 Tax=Apis cerana cerana TaxID=94128 RepID=A0A2A3ETL2_APICC|nr:hypothetical protein APICC_05849 [Apis cerana cerana]
MVKFLREYGRTFTPCHSSRHSSRLSKKTADMTFEKSSNSFRIHLKVQEQDEVYLLEHYGKQ